MLIQCDPTFPAKAPPGRSWRKAEVVLDSDKLLDGFPPLRNGNIQTRM